MNPILKTASNSIKRELRGSTRFAVRRARRVIKFVSTLYAGIGLRLPKFQRRLIARLYGNVKSSGDRLYRWVYYSTARKNAKSTLAAALCLYHLFADGEANPRIFLCATVLEQTAETFEIAERMINAQPELDRNAKVINSQNRKQIMRYKGGKLHGYVLALTSRGSKEGKNPSAVIFDELCDWTEVHRPLWRSMTMGSFARKQPLFLITTTAGEDHSTICREQYDYAKKVENGLITDRQYLPYIIEAEPGRWHEHDEQVRVNPLVVEGFISEDSIEAEETQAQASPQELAKFKNKRLNIWVGSSNGFLNMEKWRTQSVTVSDAELAGLRCFGGLDLARRDDFNALVLLFQRGQEFIAKPYFWIPEAGLAQRERRDGKPYRQWVDRGLVYLSPGETVDYHLILDKLKDLKKQFGIQEIGVDEWSAEYLVQDIERTGLIVSPHRQGFKSMSLPLKELQELVLNGRLIHNGNEILDWMAGNLVAKEDDAGNVKPTKRNRASKIDGIVALTMALGTQIRNRGPKLVSALERFQV